LVQGVKDYAIYVLDPDGFVMTWNDGAQRMKGYRAEEIIGRHFSCFYRLEDITAGHPGRCLEDARIMGRFEEENWRVRKDGSLFWAETVIAPVFDAKQEIVGFSKVARDVTERKRAHEKIQELNQSLHRHGAQLEAANKELEAFSYSVSHDLRAPLRGIDGFSLALMEDYGDKLDLPARRFLERIRAATNRMAELIDDLLNLARVTRADLHHEDVDLSAMAKVILADCQARDPERRVECEVKDGAIGHGDPRLLRVVLENLLGNAWKFTAKTSHAKIEFTATGQGERMVYIVSDNGSGFDMTYVDKLFRTFQRLHAAEQFPGSGVGLAIVQRIIHRHGGQAWAHGAVGKGAEFSFTLSENGVELDGNKSDLAG